MTKKGLKKAQNVREKMTTKAYYDERGQKTTSVVLDLEDYKKAKASGMKMSYIFKSGLEAPELRIYIRTLEERLKEAEEALNKRGDKLLFLQGEIQRLNEELDALKK